MQYPWQQTLSDHLAVGPQLAAMPPPPDPANPPQFPEPRAPVRLRRIEAGEQVLAFYHSNHHPHGFRYVRVWHRIDVLPLVGLSSGWLRATALAAWDPDEAEQRRRVGDNDALYLHVRFEGLFRDPVAGACDGLDMHVHASLVRPWDANSEQPPTALLSLLLVRWWDYWSNTVWSDYSVTSDGLLRDLVDGPCGPYAELAGEFEAFTAFVRFSSDLDKLSAHWAQAALRGTNTAAWYFLWPQQRVAADQTGGSVREQRFFALCQRMERAGIRSGWPHPSSLYRQLCGKLWIPAMSLCREHGLPPTTRVQYADVRVDPLRAAERALTSLAAIRREVWGQPPVSPSEFRGVAKLGFSWQGDDVLPFHGVDNLARVLRRLLEQRHSEQLLCLVQEMVPDVVCEYRVICVRDSARGDGVYARERLWMRMKAKGEHHNHQEACEVSDFALTSAKVLSDGEAVAELFGGDCGLRDRAQAAAERLVDRWLLWFIAESSEPPPVTRLDFLISRGGGEAGGPSAWTCEVGECGASMCSVECDARNCAALNWAVKHDPSRRFPRPLPAFARNNGWKS